MLIKRIELLTGRIPLEVPFRIATMEVRDTESLFVRISDSEGNTGTGEGNPFRSIVGETIGTVFAAAEALAPLLLGKNAFAFHEHAKTMEDFLPNNVTSRSAFDIALWDLAARRACMPLYAFLGGSRRALISDNTIGLFSPEVMAERARSFVRKGYNAVKIKLGTDASLDIERVRAIRKAVGSEVLLRVDANQGWSFPDAVKVLTAIEKWNIEYCEQPLPADRFDQLRELRRRTSIPIMADESLFSVSDALRLIKEESCDLFNIKLSKSAGITGALAIASLAEASGIECMIGCMSESRIYQSAAAHLASARPIFRYADLDGPLMHTIDPVIGGAVYEGATITPGDAPGHGAVLDEKAIAIDRRLVLE
ncbi:mandelate racemase/muconate lactonizing enzyme family protein [Sediminispirochaeta smaragdinae]|uniref:Dipeptide epimerase n=1 Tax=Sediminispirochaeta smaragdinae (strain DSM 11293 / JCM 15392 / SEBR 4228) TaxID=573413 RepID=E1R8W1_SEDSS|nr:dipeptide epimerase [Sediminispirochaeta smaragdinae]ADK81868.1 Mandelate racemase/muconate lactonizing protein [Sediminispirochaeta smaragdinae DSM 11293]